VKKLPSKFEGILELLDDGRFHALDELQEETQLNENKTRAIVAFLTEYGFAETNKRNDKVRISKAAKKLLAPL
jgi:DNA-binding IclR family transcriptional regulator